ncbi:MAG TPA: PEPxxWA-CTERM sorting domain-containing protein [Sphingobium sp.]|nr:PEPxxWA-CTERM sorting domain-containing protein [Sphingobium sp.]
MRKLLIAALLGGCVTVPAHAEPNEIVYELSGMLRIFTSSMTTGEVTGVRYETGVMTGMCTLWCQSHRVDGGFSLSSDPYLSVSFHYDDPLLAAHDGVWRVGQGHGSFWLYAGGDVGELYEYTFASARTYIVSWDDPEPSRVPSWVMTGVPEPMTWAMMMGGFALVGALMRRREITVSFA